MYSSQDLENHTFLDFVPVDKNIENLILSPTIYKMMQFETKKIKIDSSLKSNFGIKQIFEIVLPQNHNCKTLTYMIGSIFLLKTSEKV